MKACEYITTEHHSKDRVTVWCGYATPVILCGRHAQGNLTAILGKVRQEVHV